MRKALFVQPPQLIVSGHIHESCRDGQYKQTELVNDQLVWIASVGNEPLVMPFCLQASFLLVEVDDDSGMVLKIDRKVVDVEKYKDAEASLVAWKASMQQAKPSISREKRE